MEAIKPRQIIELPAQYVLIDLHQLNVKTTSRQYKSATTEYGATSYQRTEPAEQQPATSAFLKMIRQINIALEQKGPGISQPGSLKPAVGD